MKKSDYLKQLESELYKKLDYQETQSILKDYGEYFETGLRDGVSEDELCARFGNPADVAREIAQAEDIKQNIQQRRFVNYLTFFATSALLLFLQMGFANHLTISVILVILIPLSFIKWQDHNRYFVPLNPETIGILKTVALLPLLGFLLAWFFFNGAYMWTWMLNNYNGDLSMIGPSAALNLQVIYCFNLAGLLFILQNAYNKGISKKFSFSFIFTGFMQSTWCTFYVLQTISVPETIFIRLLLSTIPLAVGIIICIVSSLFFKASPKEVKSVGCTA